MSKGNQSGKSAKDRKDLYINIPALRNFASPPRHSALKKAFETALYIVHPDKPCKTLKKRLFRSYFVKQP
jgi:hypothetical protein